MSAKEPQGLPLTVRRESLLRQGSDRPFRQFVHDLLAFTARLQSIRNGFGELIGLTGAQYTILISIAHLETEGEVNVSAVADHLHISGAFVTLETGRLVRKGLVAKAASAQDRRRVGLRITAEGRELLEKLAPDQAIINDLLFGALEAPDLDRMLALLPRLIEGAEVAHARLNFDLSRRVNETAAI